MELILKDPHKVECGTYLKKDTKKISRDQEAGKMRLVLGKSGRLAGRWWPSLEE